MKKIIETNAIEMQMHCKSKESECKCNAIKENKINKENKEILPNEKNVKPCERCFYKQAAHDLADCLDNTLDVLEQRETELKIARTLLHAYQTRDKEGVYNGNTEENH